MAILHRPLFPGTCPDETMCDPACRAVDLRRESIWLSYCPLAMANGGPNHLCHFSSHRRLASPVALWERLKIGGGAPPIPSRLGWLVLYHGVGETTELDTRGRKLSYSAGVMVLSKDQPHDICYRSPQPVLTPDLPQERQGTVANVVFPTGIDRRDDLGTPDRFDVYYGMADDRIGAARLDVPEYLPLGALADPPEHRSNFSPVVKVGTIDPRVED